MATKSAQLLLEVKAETDQAKRALTEIDKAAKPLEKGITVPVKATGGDQAATQLESVAKTAKQLEKGISVAVKATGGDQAAGQLEALAKAGKEASAGVAAINAGHVGDVEGPARAAATALGQVDKAAEGADESLRSIQPPANVDAPLERTSEQLKTTERSASGTKNAFSNLVGNTAQDLSGLTGSFGSLGVAIGQVAEYTSDAANEGGGLSAALSGAASFAGPMLALAAAAFVAQKVLGDMAKRSQEAKEANDAYSGSLNKAVPLLEDWTSALDGAFKEGTLDRAGDWNAIIANTLKTMSKLDDATSALGRLGLEADDLGEAIGAADESWQGWAKSLIPGLGLTDEAAAQLGVIIDHARDLGDLQSQIGVSGKGTFGDLVTPEQLSRVESFATGVSDIREIVRALNTESKARDFNDQARAFSEYVDVVDRGRAAGETERQVALDVAAAYGQQKGAREEAARAAEEGARKTAEAGSILDQVNRQLTESEDALSAATKKVSEEQDKWLGTTITLPAAQDDLSESVISLTEQLGKQAEAGDAGAGSFEGNTKAALDNRDAQRDVYQQAFDVIDIMGQQGATTDQLAAATQEMANRAYDLAIKNGASEDAAALLRDTILTVPTSRSTDMTYAENNYGTMLDHRDTLQQDMDSTVYFHGVLDRSVVNAVNEIAAAGGIPRSVAPAGVAVAPSVAPSASLQVVGAPVAAPAAAAAPAGSRAVTVSQPVVINVNAGIVADTFQLQRAVTRSARSFQRLAGKRAA